MENENTTVNTEGNLPPKKSNSMFLIVVLLIVAVVAYLFWNSQQEKKAAASKTTEMPPVAVSAIKVTKADVPLTFEYTGQTSGYREAEVRAQVGGILMKKDYREGELIRAGQVLFRIDPSPYRATLNKNLGSLKQSQVQMNLAKVEFDRVSTLYKKNAVSKNEYDNAEASVQATRAAVDSARAAVKQSQIDLNWTTVKAPISGLSSKEQFSVGNLINVGDMLTKIVQADPVYVDFAIPADEHRALENMRASGVLKSSSSGTSVKVALGDGSVYQDSGKIDFQNQFVDPATASIKARAVFSNKGNSLYPGQFVRVYLSGWYAKDVIQIPLRATLQSSEGFIVYVLDDKNIPTAKAITIAKKINNNCLVSKGLSAGDRIITDGVAKVIPGKAVMVIDDAALPALKDVSSDVSGDSPVKQN